MLKPQKYCKLSRERERDGGNVYEFGSDNGTRTPGTTVPVPADFRQTSAADFRLAATWGDLPDFEETQRTSRRSPRRDITRGERPIRARRSRNDRYRSAAVKRRDLRLFSARTRAATLAKVESEK